MDSPPQLSTGPGRIVAVVASVEAMEAGWGPPLATDLTEAWAAAGHKVVLVDGGLTTPSLHAALGTSNAEGLTDAVLFGVSVGRVAESRNGGRWFFIPAGTAVADAADVASHERWKGLGRGFVEAGATLVVFVPDDEPARDGLMSSATDVVVLAEESRAAGGSVDRHGAHVRAVLGPGVATRNDVPAAGDFDDARTRTLAHADPGTESVATASVLDAADIGVDEPSGSGDTSDGGGDPAELEDDLLPGTDRDTERSTMLGDPEPEPGPVEVLQEDSEDPLFAALGAGGSDTDEGWHDATGGPTAEAAVTTDTESDPPVVDGGDGVSVIDRENPGHSGSPGRDAPGDDFGKGPDDPPHVHDTPVLAEPSAAPPPPVHAFDRAALYDPARVPTADEILEEAGHAVAGGGSNLEAEVRRDRERQRAASRRSFLLLVLLGVLVATAAAWWFGYVDIPGLGVPPRPSPVGEVSSLQAAETGAADVVADAVERSPSAPFSVALEAHREAGTAARRVAEFAGRYSGAVWTLAPVNVGDGVFYRVLVGAVSDEVDAARLMDDVAEGLGVDPSGWLVRATPLAFAIGDFDTLESAQARAGELTGGEVRPYVLARDFDDGATRYRIYVGGFETEDQAGLMATVLADRGVEASLSPRTGRLPE